MSWTLERVGKLKQLWGKGNTAGQIASIIGGVTRNAVIGKAFRLNLAAKFVQKKKQYARKINTPTCIKFLSANWGRPSETHKVIWGGCSSALSEK